MRSYYASTVVGMGIALAAAVTAAILANSAAANARRRFTHEVSVAATRRAARSLERQTVVALQEAMEPVRTFSSAWERATKRPDRQSAELIRIEMETIAQRQLGLVTDGAITPQPERFSFAGSVIPAQRVTLRASGKDIAGLVTWLGCVEEKYPLAVIEQCDFSSNVGGNTGLTIRLVQPLQRPASVHSTIARIADDMRTQPARIASTPWLEYLPPRLKSPIPIGFERNPLQPAVAADRGPAPGLRTSDIGLVAQLEAAVTGRLHSVVRGTVPVINVDGKLFRVGDELVIGPGRDKPVANAKTKLKLIGNQQLVFHVSGGTAGRPIECDVTYKLPVFFEAR